MRYVHMGHNLGMDALDPKRVTIQLKKKIVPEHPLIRAVRAHGVTVASCNNALAPLNRAYQTSSGALGKKAAETLAIERVLSAIAAIKRHSTQQLNALRAQLPPGVDIGGGL